MKKEIINKFLVLAAVALGSFTACQKELLPDASIAGENAFEIQAVPDESKTVNDGLYTRWATGDQIAVMHCASSASEYGMDGAFTLSNSETGSFLGTVSGTLTPSVNYKWFAFYPYDAAMKQHVSDAVLAVGGTQTQSGNGSKAHLAGKAFPLYGKTTAKGSDLPVVTMSHVASIVEFTVTNHSGSSFSVNEIALTVPEGTMISGKFSISVPDSEPEVTYVRDGSNTAVLTVSGGQAIANNGSATFYLGIAPCSVAAGKTLSLRINDYEKSVTLSTAETFAPGKIKSLRFDYNLPLPPATLYVVDNASHVIPLTRTSRYHYESTSIAQANTLGSAFLIAEKVNGTTIDNSGYVAGGSDFRAMVRTTSSGTKTNKPSVYSTYNVAPDYITFDMDKCRANFRQVLDKNTMPAYGSSTTKVKWIMPLVQGGEIQLLNFSEKASKALAMWPFSNFDDTKGIATYDGIDRNYETYYAPDAGWIVLQDIAGASESIFLIGRNASYPLSPYLTYSLRDDTFLNELWGHTEAYGQLSMYRKSTNVYQALLYLGDDWAVQLYTNRAWAANVKSLTTNTPDLVTVHNENICFLTQNINVTFYPGLYMLEYNKATGVVSLTYHSDDPEADPQWDVEEVFPILGWAGIDINSSAGQNAFNSMRDAGFTLYLSGYGNQTDMFKALNMAKTAGVQMITTTPELANSSTAASVVNQLLTNTAFYGYFVADELWSAQEYAGAKSFVTDISKLDNKHMFYLNFPPNWAWNVSDYTGTCTNYVQYTGVKLFSFDHYPIYTGKEGSSFPATLNPIWYQNLESALTVSRNAGVPFWAFALALAHNQGASPYYVYPVPTLGHLRLQQFSNLVYGAQGFEYFTYWGLFQNSRTPVYQRARTVNRELQSLGRVFKDATIQWVKHTGSSIPTGTTALGSSLPSGVSSLTTSTSGAVVSYFTKSGSRYVAIVNRSIDQNMSLNISFSGTATEICKDGRDVPVTSFSGSLTAGDIKVYRLP